MKTTNITTSALYALMVISSYMAIVNTALQIEPKSLALGDDTQDAEPSITASRNSIKNGAVGKTEPSTLSAKNVETQGRPSNKNLDTKGLSFSSYGNGYYNPYYTYYPYNSYTPYHPSQTDHFNTTNNTLITKKYVGKLIVRNGASNADPYAIRESSLPKPYRILSEGTITTLEYIWNRLTFTVNKKNIIIEARYG